MAGVAERIAELKESRNAVILAHNYTSADVQDIADFVGDSLGLSIAASETDADVIVFCGVSFMGETAKILSPKKRVLLPVPDALCDMAAMCPAEDLRRKKQEHPNAVVVGYVNTTAAAKCQMDICCTSGNALKVVSSIDDDEILFVPDRNLGSYVSEKVPGKRLILWDGCCPIHDRITKEEVLALKQSYPNAPSMAHPECRSEILEMVDHVGSTEDMIRFCRSSDAKEFIVITETGMRHRLEREFPGRAFRFPESAVCEPMKRITPENVLACLENLSGEVLLPEEVIAGAREPVRRMTGMK